MSKEEDFTQSEEMKQLFLSETEEYLQSLNQSLIKLEKNPDGKSILNEIFRVAHTLKGMAGTMGFNKISELSHEMESLFNNLRNGKLKVTSEMIDIFLECSDTLQLLKEEVVSGEEKDIDVDAVIKRLKQNFDQESIEKDKKKRISKEKKKAPSQATSVKIESSTNIKVNVKHLDLLMDLVGELVINKARLMDIADKHEISELGEAIKQFDTVAFDLQEAVLKTRMVPLSFIFGRYPRMIRDVSRKKNKDIDLVIEGSEIEVDRMLLEKINEPLVHLLRNAVDHGIEEPEQRKKAGKSETGEVKLVAKRERDYVTIEVQDDGKGISVDKIRKSAVDKGFISKQEAENLPPNKALMLICEPGFSTAKKVTDISGRGVGMDTVKSLVESFNGNMEINSKEGKGTTFKIQLPLRVAIIRALLINSMGETFAIPLKDVSEIITVDKSKVKT
ncbi:MAG: chemotaxis protein CheA, partial [Elusimicrobiota bacterium]